MEEASDLDESDSDRDDTSEDKDGDLAAPVKPPMRRQEEPAVGGCGGSCEGSCGKGRQGHAE